MVKQKNKQKVKTKKKYEKRISLWPLKPEEALKAFMEVDPNKIKKRRIK